MSQDQPFYIGTRARMLNTRMPSVGMGASKSGWESEITYLNGGASGRQSMASHKRYELTWNTITRDQARVIMDIRDGLCGPGAVYFHDPFVADRNCLPQWWASPMQGLYDGLPLTRGSDRGESVPTPDNDLELPVEGVRYTVTADGSRSVWVPVPTGHTAYVFAWGQSGTGGGLVATPTTGATGLDSPSVVPLASPSTPTPTPIAITASSGYNGVLISLGGTGTVTLYGIMVQVLPDAQSPTVDHFVSGQGNSGCTMRQPEYTPYSAAYDTVGLVVELVETEGWEQ